MIKPIILIKIIEANLIQMIESDLIQMIIHSLKVMSMIVI